MARKPYRRPIKHEQVLEVREEIRKAALRNKDKLVALPLKEAIKQLDKLLGENND